MRFMAVVAVLLALATQSHAQLKDGDFQVPAKPGPFNDKAVTFAPPAEAKPVEGKPPPPLWTGGAEFGFTGSEGNSEVLNLRLGGLVRRADDSNIFNADLNYALTKTQNILTQNKALFNVRDECLFTGSPWGVFIAGQVEYDDFRAFDFRVASHAGVGYGFIKTDWLTIRGRLGAGAAREVGGNNDRWVPEGLLGGDVFLAMSERQGVIACADYYPDLGRFERYRVRARAAYQILIDPEWGLTLRLGVQDRFDSNPGPATKKNDFDYFGTLMIKF